MTLHIDQAIKGEVYRFDYKKSGAWNADGSDASFWEEFYKEKNLFLPVFQFLGSRFCLRTCF